MGTSATGAPGYTYPDCFSPVIIFEHLYSYWPSIAVVDSFPGVAECTIHFLTKVAIFAWALALKISKKSQN